MTPSNNVSSHKHIQGGDHLEWHPADEEGQEDGQNQSCGFLLGFLTTEPLYRLDFQSLNYFECAECYNWNWDDEAKGDQHPITEHFDSVVWVFQKACCHTIVGEVLHLPEDERGGTQEQSEPPHEQTAQFGIFWPTHSAMGHCVHQRHISIYTDQNEEVDAAVCVHLNTKVDNFTKELTKRPVEIIGYVDSPER